MRTGIVALFRRNDGFQAFLDELFAGTQIVAVCQRHDADHIARSTIKRKAMIERTMNPETLFTKETKSSPAIDPAIDLMKLAAQRLAGDKRNREMRKQTILFVYRCEGVSRQGVFDFWVKRSSGPDMLIMIIPEGYLLSEFMRAKVRAARRQARKMRMSFEVWTEAYLIRNATRRNAGTLV